MSHYARKKREHIGISPYALVFRGQQKTGDALVSAVIFDGENTAAVAVKSLKKLAELAKNRHSLWITIEGLHDVGIFGALAKDFNIPQNILSEVLNPSLRPKFQEFDGGFFVSLKTIFYDEKSDTLSAENVSIIILGQTLLLFCEQQNPLFAPVSERVIKQSSKIHAAGTDYLAFMLIDVIVDNYIYIAGLLGNGIEDLDGKMESGGNEILGSINHFKCEMTFMRKSIKPAREVIFALNKPDFEQIKTDNRIHFRELMDNINEAAELTDSYREMLYDLSATYHTSLSTRLNDIMRILTIISVIFIPLTFIVGIYGTNFDILPEIHWHYGYLAMWIVMLAIVALMLFLFKKKNWL